MSLQPEHRLVQRIPSLTLISVRAVLAVVMGLVMSNVLIASLLSLVLTGLGLWRVVALRHAVR